MDRASRDRDLDQLLDELEVALGEFRDRLHGSGHRVSRGQSPRDGHGLTGEAAISAAAEVLEANARVLSLLSEAIDRVDSNSGHPAPSGIEPRDHAGREFDNVEGTVGGAEDAGARTLLDEIRQLNAEIADRLEGGESTPADQGVEIAVEAELKSIREDLGETREE